MMLAAACTLCERRRLVVAAARIPAVAGVPALLPTFTYTSLHASELYKCTYR